MYRAEEMCSYKAKGQLRYGDLVFAGRPIGTVKAMSFSGSTQNKPPSVVFIDEVVPPHSMTTGPTPGLAGGGEVKHGLGYLVGEKNAETGPTPCFAQLSCLQRQRSR